MMPPVYDFPQEWYQFTRLKIYLQARSQSSARPWLGGKSIYGPHAQMWLADLTLTVQEDPRRQQIAAFFSRLDGQAGLLRIGDASRLKPWHDRSIVATTETFTDGSIFSDGTGFSSGLLPPNVYVAATGVRGDNFITMNGFPASLASALTRGDLLQINPSGVPGNVPHLYEVMFDGATDASGSIGVEIRPRLRAGIAIGDQVSLRYASSVFRLVDDDQGAIEVTVPVIGSGGFTLIEALDQVV